MMPVGVFGPEGRLNAFVVALALLETLPLSAAAQWTIAPTIARTEAEHIAPALKVEWQQGSSHQRAPVCWGRSRTYDVNVGGTVFGNARDNPGTIGVAVQAGAALDVSCQGRLEYPNPTPIGGFDYGTLGIGPSVSLAGNQAFDEILFAPGMTAFYLAPGNTVVGALLPDLHLSLAANRPLRSARRDSIGLALGWERRWDAVGYWNIPLRDAASAPAFAPVRLAASVHAWQLNTNARVYANETASERIATDITLMLRAPRTWSKIASIDLSWREGRLPEQPERRRAVGVGVTLR